jgi:hypothetical protein
MPPARVFARQHVLVGLVSCGAVSLISAFRSLLHIRHFSSALPFLLPRLRSRFRQHPAWPRNPPAWLSLIAKRVQPFRRRGLLPARRRPNAATCLRWRVAIVQRTCSKNGLLPLTCVFCEVTNHVRRNRAQAAVRALKGQFAVRFLVDLCPRKVEWVAFRVVYQLRFHRKLLFLQSYSPTSVQTRWHFQRVCMLKHAHPSSSGSLHTARFVRVRRSARSEYVKYILGADSAHSTQPFRQTGAGPWVQG